VDVRKITHVSARLVEKRARRSIAFCRDGTCQSEVITNFVIGLAWAWEVASLGVPVVLPPPALRILFPPRSLPAGSRSPAKSTSRLQQYEDGNLEIARESEVAQSLVAACHAGNSPRDWGVAGSNPAAPTKILKYFMGLWGCVPSPTRAEMEQNRIKVQTSTPKVPEFCSLVVPHPTRRNAPTAGP
jgi:hypothetical protein